MRDTSFVYTPIERTSRRLGVFLLIVLGLILTMTLFFVKTQAKEAKADVARLEAGISDHETAIAVLTAEEAVLSNPHRLRALSEGRLSLEPVSTEQTTTLVDLSAKPLADGTP